MYPYGLIGNCQTSALVGLNGAVEWMCAPQPDSPPVIGRLLDPDGGHFSIASAISSTEIKTEQRYLANTNILLTTVTLPNGDAFQMTDFCPRFEQYGRIYRPAALFRLVEPLQGIPGIRVSCRPVSGWEKTPVQPVRGSNHLRYDIRGESLRLLTNMPLTYLCDETPVALTRSSILVSRGDSALKTTSSKSHTTFLNRQYATGASGSKTARCRCCINRRSSAPLWP